MFTVPFFVFVTQYKYYMQLKQNGLQLKVKIANCGQTELYYK